MAVQIKNTSFGNITTTAGTYDHDIVITPEGEILKRKKKLSKEIYGTSHIISLEEAKHIYREGAEKLIVGTGQTGFVELSKEAADFFREKRCKTYLRPTPEAITLWNKTDGKNIGLFHVTC
ncbi:Mth938-like domain-containing protein [Anaerophaga thermohalophila]|uniref:Mth938-like domain-containing protein n=1 Tax=Anaerophaga thermohalophila TaxID=177400 RepID=UPI0002EEAB88|nr:MTH938/NDUFAF3 family protein [Anaerophaga thermohalophila]